MSEIMEKKIMVLCFLLAVLPTTSAFSAKYFDFSPRAKDAYQKVFALRLEEARWTIQELKQQEPDNLISVFLENYLEVLRIGVDDDEAAYHRFSKNMDIRLNQLARGEPRSPYYRYTQAETRLQWALLRARFGDYLASLSDIKLAYALLEENDRRFPDFIANKKSLGMLHALVGNVPDDYRWAVRLLGGLNGSIEQGIAELETVLIFAGNHEFLFEAETLIGYGILQVQLNNQGAKAWNRLKNSALKPEINPLHAFALATVALRTGHTNEAIQLLQETPSGGAYYPFHYRNFLLGVAKLYRLDADAHVPLQTFIDQFKGKNAVKEAYQKLAWYHLIQGNTAAYYGAMWQVKQQGAARSDPDKAALREAYSAEIPDPRLLKARLLFDGAFYTSALELIKNNGADYAYSPRNNLEYHYRMGRIAHKMGKLEEASRYYETTIQSGEKMPWYFACNAALQLGTLLEEKTDIKSARVWYQKCLSIKPEEYAASLHTKAKAGLNRLQ